MLKSSDIVVITKGDIVSQAEREVFASRVNTVNPSATIMHINGLTGQGSFELSTLLYDKEKDIDTLKGKELRFPMPQPFVPIVWEKPESAKATKWEMLEKSNWMTKEEYEQIQTYTYKNI